MMRSPNAHKMLVAENIHEAHRMRSALELPVEDWEIGSFGMAVVARPFDKIVVFVPQHSRQEHYDYINKILWLRIQPGGELTVFP